MTLRAMGNKLRDFSVTDRGRDKRRTVLSLKQNDLHGHF